MHFISLNGQLTPHDDARISPSDAGFLHGAGLFETMRVHRGTIFRLRQHLARLAASAAELSIPISLTESQLSDLATDLLEANDLREDARLRLTITRGDLHPPSSPPPTTTTSTTSTTTSTAPTAEPAEPDVTLLLTATAFTPYPPAPYEKGLTVIISRSKQNPENPLTGHKTTSYFDRLLALREAQRAGAGEALWFTPHNETLAEASISNVFIVTPEGLLVTPPLTVRQMLPDGTSRDTRLCLPGITRETILQLATDLQILPHQRAITITALLAAQEVFLTNVIMGVMPVTKIERHPIADQKPGEMTRKLQEAYGKKLAEECT